ncbi:hypothetical protein [Bacillus marinisedimentorum]|uniref:hypothetical protein n=1 Tax=Bacillus marinisedimentorum TaxID=1821260 RepID=UPI0014716D45|nr:hypothetical protein [Bacillus marinisedimentorum]
MMDMSSFRKGGLVLMGLSSLILIIFIAGIALLMVGTTKQNMSYRRISYALIAAAILLFFLQMGLMRG